MQSLLLVDSFKGDYEKFSNFYPCIIHYEGFDFPTVEHAYIASKTIDMAFRKNISLLEADQVGLAKKLGRRCKLKVSKADWEVMKILHMKKFLEQKFSQDHFRLLLLSTGDATLVEGNYWHDNYWGNYKCKRCKSIPGKNNLGKLLMKIRKSYR